MANFRRIGRHLVTLATAFVATNLALPSAPLQAAAPINEQMLFSIALGKTDQWGVGLSRNIKDGRLSCGLTRSDLNKPFLLIELEREGKLSVRLNDERWSLPEDQIYRVSVLAGDFNSPRHPALAINKNWIGFVLKDPRQFLLQLAAGQTLKIRTPQAAFDFEFSTGREAVAMFLKCFSMAPWDRGPAVNPFTAFAARYKSAKELRGRNPNPFIEPQPTDAEAEGEAEQRLLKFAQKTLNASGFLDVQFMSAADLAEVKSAKAGWYARGHFGYLFEDTTRMEPRLFATNKLRALNNECKGEFGSRTGEPVIAGRYTVVRTFGVCDTDRSTTDIATVTVVHDIFAWTFVFLPHRGSTRSMERVTERAATALIKVLGSRPRTANRSPGGSRP